MLNIKESRARELLRYSVENNILEKLGKTRNIKYVKKQNRRKKPSEKTVGKKPSEKTVGKIKQRFLNDFVA